MNENGYCPHCNADLDGEDMVETFIKKGSSPEEAAEYVKDYGYCPGHTKWGRQVCLYDVNFDMTTGYQCPDCEKTWSIFK